MLNDARRALEIIGDIAAYKEQGAMPDFGGRLDQDPRWIQALSIHDATMQQIGEWRRKQEALAGG